MRKGNIVRTRRVFLYPLCIFKNRIHPVPVPGELFNLQIPGIQVKVFPVTYNLTRWNIQPDDSVQIVMRYPTSSKRDGTFYQSLNNPPVHSNNHICRSAAWGGKQIDNSVTPHPQSTGSWDNTYTGIAVYPASFYYPPRIPGSSYPGRNSLHRAHHRERIAFSSPYANTLFMRFTE